MSKFVGGSEGLRHALVNLAMFNEEIPTLHETKLAQLARKNGYAAPRAGRSSDGLITPRRATGLPLGRSFQEPSSILPSGCGRGTGSPLPPSTSDMRWYPATLSGAGRSDTKTFTAVAYGTKQTAEQRSDANSEDSQILQKATRPCLRHRRHLRCHRRFRDPFAADRVGGGSWDSAAAVHGVWPAMAAVAGTGSGGDPGLGGASIMAAGGWGDCCPGHSSPKFRTALTNSHFAPSSLAGRKVSIIVRIVGIVAMRTAMGGEREHSDGVRNGWGPGQAQRRREHQSNTFDMMGYIQALDDALQATLRDAAKFNRLSGNAG